MGKSSLKTEDKSGAGLLRTSARLTDSKTVYSAGLHHSSVVVSQCPATRSMKQRGRLSDLLFVVALFNSDGCRTLKAIVMLV